MEEEVRDAVFGNVGTMISFRVGAFDAEVLEKEFAPTFMATDLVNLGFTQIYLKLMIDGVSSQPFSATTTPSITKPDITFKNQVIEMSRKQFAHPRADVERGIVDWHESGNVKPEKREEQKKPLPPVDSEKKNNGVDENKLALIRAAEELKNRERAQKQNDETVSLGEIKKEKELSLQLGKKNPSKENLSSLKDALKGVLDKKPEQNHVKHEKTKEEKIPEIKSKLNNEIKSKQEVPEDVLRSLLKMEDK